MNPSVTKLFLLSVILFLESCFFGAGLLEKEITDDYWLFANNYWEDMIILKDNYAVVEETVFAVGYDDDFIIAKSHPKINDREVDKSITYYHIIDLNETAEYNQLNNTMLNFDQFKAKRVELGVEDEIEFTIVFDEVK